MKDNLNDLLQKASANIQKASSNIQSISIPGDLSKSPQIQEAIRNIHYAGKTVNLAIASVPKPVVVTYSQNEHIRASLANIRQALQSL